MRRLALLIASLLIASTAHATGNIAFQVGTNGQLLLNGAPIGVPHGTALDVCSARPTGPCLVLGSNATWQVVGNDVLHDATGKPLDVLTTVRLEKGRVTEELVQVSENGKPQFQVRFSREGVVSVVNG